jgi:hypothetical protein
LGRTRPDFVTVAIPQAHHENTAHDIFDLMPEPKEAAMPNARTDRTQPITHKSYDLERQLVRLRTDSPIRRREALTVVRDPGFDLMIVALNAGVRR